MWLSPLFERFVENSPVTVIVRTLMEVILAEEKLDQVFAQTAQTGYTREILFSTLVNMMIQVVCSVRQSIGAVYQALAGELGVSKAAVYGKLNRLEPRVSQARRAHYSRGTGDSRRTSGRPTGTAFTPISPQNCRWQ